jgi:y4mF family transcriptional regulator
MAASVLKWFNKAEQQADAPAVPPASAPEAAPAAETAHPAKARFLRPKPNELAIQDLKSLLAISTGQAGSRFEPAAIPGQDIDGTPTRGLGEAADLLDPSRPHAADDALALAAASCPAPGGNPARTPLSGPEEIGARVRQRRRALELTQAELAVRAGVGKRFMVEVEQGKPTLEVGKLMQVVAACGLTLSIG